MSEKRSRSRSISSRCSTSSISSEEPEVKLKKRRVQMYTGTIQSIHLENFMCHSKFTWELRSAVNLVTGANGAGKSSILQAIVLGLHGSAKNIKRYNRAADYVKKDCSKAVIEITLCNEGEEAYKPVYYGRSITFQRTIYATGNNVFQLKGEDNKARKDKAAKDDWMKILEQFKIFIDNPLVILHQDTAKEFLNLEKPEKMYEFFVKGTMLDEIHKYYQCADLGLRETEGNIKKREATLRQENRELEEIKRKVRTNEEKQNNEREMRELRKHFAWKQIQLKGRARDRLEKEQETLESQKKEDDLVHIELHKENKVLQDRLALLNTRMEEERSKYRREEEELGRLKGLEENLRVETRNHVKIMRDLDKRRQDCVKAHKTKARIYAEHSDPGTREEMRRRKEETMSTLAMVDIQITRMIKEVETRAEELESHQEEEKKINIAKLECVRELDRLDQQINQAERTKKELSVNNNNPLCHYGLVALRVDEDMRRETRFTRPPIGPIGQYVRLKSNIDQRVANVIETHIGHGNLKSYVCDNYNDSRLLRDILKKHYSPRIPKVTVSRFQNQRHDTRPDFHKPNCDHPVVIDCLDVEDVQAFNFLVDQCQLENVVITQTQDLAKAITTRRENVPTYVDTVLTADGYKFCPPTGTKSYRSFYMDLTPAKLIPRVDSAPAKQLDEEIRVLTNKQKEVLRDKETLMKDIHLISLEITRTKENMKKDNEELKRFKQEKSKNLNRQSAEQLEEQDSDAGSIEDTIEQLEREISDLDSRLLEMRDTKEKMDAEFDTIVRRQAKALSAYNKIRGDLVELEMLDKQKEELQNHQRIKEKNFTKKAAELKKLKSRIELLTRKVAVETEKIQNDMTKFHQNYPGGITEHPDNIQKIEGRIAAIRNKLKDSGQSDNSFNRHLFQEKLKKVKQMKEENERLKSLHSMLKEQSHMRLTTFIWIRKQVGINFCRQFHSNSILFSKEFGGLLLKLEVDHKTRQVKLIFIDSEQDQIDKDLKTLSGGEQSYAQMCLILSIWSSLHSPFRALDEWDVYLDHVNRQKISQELIKQSLKSEGVQSIFISPQGAAIDRSKITREQEESVEIREIFKKS